MDAEREREIRDLVTRHWNHSGSVTAISARRVVSEVLAALDATRAHVKALQMALAAIREARG